MSADEVTPELLADVELAGAAGESWVLVALVDAARRLRAAEKAWALCKTEHMDLHSIGCRWRDGHRCDCWRGALAAALDRKEGE